MSENTTENKAAVKTEEAPQEAKKAPQQTSEAPKTTDSAFALGCVFARKSGMTRYFTDDGKSLPVTVLDMENKTVITQVKDKKKDHYCALQLGFHKRKQQHANKPEIGHFKKANAPAFYHVEEFRLAKSPGDPSPGTVISTEFLEKEKFVDVMSFSKGKGFQGVMKRWNFSGSCDSHGHSLVHRVGGSIGQNTSPGRVFPGKKMGGHMGDVRHTIQNVRVVSFDKEKNVLLLNGAVPGGKGAIVRITLSKKKSGRTNA